MHFKGQRRLAYHLLNFPMTDTHFESGKSDISELIRESFSELGLEHDDESIRRAIDQSTDMNNPKYKQKLDGLRGLRISYVDDSEDYLHAAITKLTIVTERKVTGILCTRQSTPDTIIDQILASKPDVVLLDKDFFKNWAFNGLTIAQKLQKSHPDLLLIGASQNEDAFENLGIPGFGKPADVERISSIATGITDIQKRVRESMKSLGDAVSE